MNKDTELSLLSLILPEGILEYFDIVGFDKKPIKHVLYENRLTIYLEEKKQINSFTLNYRSVLNYFLNRSTNASAESFNAKVKAFRSQFRGVRNTEYFLYRLIKLYS